MNSRHKKLIVIGAAIVLLVLCLFVFGGRAKKQDDRALSDYSEEVTTEAEVASESQAELNADMEMLQEAMEEDHIHMYLIIIAIYINILLDMQIFSQH